MLKFCHSGYEFTTFDQGCSFLLKWLSKVCRLKRKFQIRVMDMKSKVKVDFFIKICLTVCNVNCTFIS